MKLEVKRQTETAKSIIGELWIDGQFENFTLEPARSNPVNPGHPCIPAGQYELELTFSPHFQMVTPEVMNVPGRSAIRIHPGNFPKDTLGCTLVGEDKGVDQVFRSRPVFDRLMVLLKASIGPFTIIYYDPVS